MDDRMQVERLGDEPDRDGDLRQNRSRQVQLLLNLGDLLTNDDRALVEAIYMRGMTAAEFARAARTRPRTVQRRLWRLSRRVNTPVFRLVAVRCNALPPLCRAIGRRVVLRGESQRSVAASLGVSLHRVRQELTSLRTLGVIEGRDGPPW